MGSSFAIRYASTRKFVWKSVTLVLALQQGFSPAERRTAVSSGCRVRGWIRACFQHDDLGMCDVLPVSDPALDRSGPGGSCGPEPGAGGAGRGGRHRAG